MKNTKAYCVVWTPVMTILALLFFGATNITAAPGDLDLTFGVSGKAITSFGLCDQLGEASIVQTDGKIVSGGQSCGGENTEMYVARFNADGTPDVTFGTNGRVVIDFDGSNDGVTALAVQMDGKIVAVGDSWSVAGGARVTLARLDPDGSLDTTFDGDGKRIFTDQYYSRSVAITPDGKIVIVGLTYGNYDTSYVARFNSDGSNDVTFDGDGIATMDLTRSTVWAADVKIQNDGKIVVACNIPNGNFYFAIFRYTSTGALDSTFGGGDGIATAFEGLGSPHPNSLAIQPNGSIVTAGDLSIGDVRSFAVVRHNPDGTIDTGFGTNGTAVIGFTGSSAGHSVAVQSDGKILLAGHTDSNNQSQFALARLNANGSTDSAFGSNGRVTTTFAGSGSADYAAINADGRIVVMGNGYGGNSSLLFDIARYMPDGSLDATFDGDGMLAIQTGRSSYDYANAVAELPNGKYLTVGNSNDTLAITRHNADGSLDTSFDGDGRLLTNHIIGVTDAIVQSDGKIVVTGRYDVANEFRFKIIRLNSDGTTDTSFGSGGVSEITFPGFVDAYSYSLAIQTDGKYIITGTVISVTTNHSLHMGLARLNTDGSLDTTFDGDGKVTTDINGNDIWIAAVKIQPDGKIIAAGQATVNSAYTFALVRYNVNGSLDTTFDGDGKVVTVFPSTSSSYVNDLAIQPDGKIVASGAAGNLYYPEYQQTFGVARYNSDGSLDNTFDGDGLLRTSFANFHPAATAVLVRPNGKVLVVGGKFHYDPYNDYAYDNSIVVAQYNNDGTLDTGFGNGGVGEYFVPEKYANAAAITSDGKLVIAGAAVGYESDFLISRIQLNEPSPTPTPTPTPTPSPTRLNPIDSPDFFISQQYRDFLGREPDANGFANWMATLTGCPNGGYGEFDSPYCDRVHVSAGFVQSHEFQGRGYWILRFGYVGLNRSIGSVRSSATYAEFTPALAQVGGSNSPAQEEAAKVIYANAFVQRQDFLALFPTTMTASQYVNGLETNAQVTLPNKQTLIDALNAGTMTRADVLRNVVESQVVFDKYLIPAFVTMEYFGYLRRDPDTIGYQNWVNTLTADPSNYRHMIFGFIYSTEYRNRFGP